MTALVTACVLAAPANLTTSAAPSGPAVNGTDVISAQPIEWTWNDGGITAMDDWESPIV